MALNYVTITGTFDDGSGTALTGTVTFTPSQTVYSSGVPLVSTAQPIVAQVIAGALKSPSGGTLQLLATDNTGLTLEGLTGFWFWTAAVNVGGAQSFSFFLLHTPATQDLYSLANTAASGGFANPMTTLGDIIFENATPAAARLAGSTSATKNFLTQTGTGSVSAAPAWGTIAVGDIPSLATTFTFGSTGAAPSSGTYTAGQVLADQNGVVRACIAGGSPGTWTRAGQKPWEFYADDYGALGNGRVIGDGVINATTTFTSASAGFTSADTGKSIMINGGQGTTSAPLITTITFVNATTVTLGSAASATASGCQAIYGTDDTTAVNNAVAASKTYALASNFKAQIIGGSKNYCLASGPTQTGNGSSTPTFNSQIPVPFPNANGTTQKLIIEFLGPGNQAHAQYFQGTIPGLEGFCLVSMVLAPASGGSATFGAQSVIGGPTGSFGFTGGFANVKVVLTGVMIVCPALSQQMALDFRYCSAADVDLSSCQAFASVLGNSPTLPSLTTNGTFTAGNSIGVYMPLVTNNAVSNIGRFCVEGFTFSMAFAEHLNAQWLLLVYANVAMFVNEANTVSQHGVSILMANVEACNQVLQASGPGSADIFSVRIGLLDCEVINTWHVNDTTNSFNGEIYLDTEGNTPLVNGAGNLRIIYASQARGHMASPPAVPASTSTATLVYRDAWVSIHTGVGVTVSAVTIDGTATGLTMAASSSLAVQVPSGKTIAMTYAGGTPTWDWWLS